MDNTIKDVEVLRPADAARAVARCLQTGLTPFLHGRPGVGKSAIVGAVARAAGVECRTFSLALVQPEDIRVPVPTATGLAWRYAEALPREGRGILFLDEFPQANESVQSVFGQLLYQGRLDEYELPAGWAVVCAGNRLEDMAAAHTIPTQIRNRVVHLEVETSVRDWARYRPDEPLELGTVTIGPKLADGEPHPLLVGLAEARPDALETPPNWTERLAWPTPRTLSLASAYMQARGELDEIDWAVIAGLVGRPLATELRAWWRLRDQVPTLEEVVAGRATPPADPVARWVAAMMVADMAGRDIRQRTFDAAMRYIAACGIPHLAVAGTRLCRHAAKSGKTAWLSWEGAKLCDRTLREAGVLS